MVPVVELFTMVLILSRVGCWMEPWALLENGMVDFLSGSNPKYSPDALPAEACSDVTWSRLEGEEEPESSLLLDEMASSE